MLGVLLDLVVILGMQVILEGMADDWRDMIFPVLAITVGNLAVAYGLGAMLGLFTLIPMALLTFAILLLWCGMSVRNAAITAVVVIGLKFGIAFMMA